jgi:hypothetical protein
MAKLNQSNYCVVETSKVASVKGGPIIAQYELDYALKATGVENGMLLAVDHAERKVKLPTDATEEVYLHASEEQIYNDYEGREHFILKSPKLPRLFAIGESDVWETDAVEMNGLNPSTGVLAVVNSDGFATLQESTYDYSGDAKVMATKPITLPNGKYGFKFTVIKG